MSLIPSILMHRRLTPEERGAGERWIRDADAASAPLAEEGATWELFGPRPVSREHRLAAARRVLEARKVLGTTHAHTLRRLLFEAVDLLEFAQEVTKGRNLYAMGRVALERLAVALTLLASHYGEQDRLLRDANDFACPSPGNLPMLSIV